MAAFPRRINMDPQPPAPPRLRAPQWSDAEGWADEKRTDDLEETE